ncbi:LCP family protein [Microbacterium sp. SLBN-146]|uniref:LCP family protein n=1 Tax=Microbacterium sp. SLBN-146 TaxID=2768457 RepID=UPI00114FEC5D|nr:LCP family protein [Microbacterium sp. SLBN-146]TQJ30881.1 LytR family transcriptional attenuator [Microbacterium sp. SLBN-146]
MTLLTAHDALSAIEQRFGDRQSTHSPGGVPARRRRTWRAVWVTLAVLAALLLAAVVLVWFLVGSVVSAVTVLPDDEIFPAASGRPSAAAVAPDTNILILGTDSRAGLGDAEDLQDGTATGQRSDTMMLVNIAGDGSGAAVISLMRDSWVSIPGHGEAKLNAAMSWGGLPLAVETVESLLGQRIDHVAVVDFEGFADISEALGGVPVESPIAFDSLNMKGYSFTHGENIVEGDRALAFVRERYAFADGDYQRVRNQRSFLEGAFSRLRDVSGRFDALRLNAALRATASHLTVDAGVTLPWMVEVGTAVAQLPDDRIVSFTLPTTGTGTSADGQSIVVVDDALTAQLVEQLSSGDVIGFARDNQLTGADS